MFGIQLSVRLKTEHWLLKTDMDAGKKTNTDLSGEWFILGAAVLWGTTGTSQALAPTGADPISVGLVRLAIGGVLLLLWALWRGAFRGGEKWSVKATAVGGICVATYQIFFFAGVARTGVAIGTMVAIGSAPIIAGLLDWFVQGERPSRKWVAATILAITGAMFLSGLGQNRQANIDLIGLLLAVGTGASYALYALASKQLVQVHKPDAVMAVLFMLGAILLLPFLFTIDVGWIRETQGLLVALHLGVITTAVSYILFARGLVTVGVATAVTLSLAEPLTAATLGIFLLGEAITLTTALGMALIFAGLALLSMKSTAMRATEK